MPVDDFWTVNHRLLSRPAIATRKIHGAKRLSEESTPGIGGRHPKRSQLPRSQA